MAVLQDQAATETDFRNINSEWCSHVEDTSQSRGHYGAQLVIPDEKKKERLAYTNNKVRVYSNTAAFRVPYSDETQTCPFVHVTDCVTAWYGMVWFGAVWSICLRLYVDHGVARAK